MTKQKKLELSPRLQLLANWVQPGVRIADVGTDHAFLPVWLALQGRVSGAIASDLREGPLARGAETAREYGAANLVETRLCGGLDAIRPEEVDTVIIAGMGGETIVHILEKAPWTADGSHTLLLQPMSKVEMLREFLAGNGYEIVREQLVQDRGTVYPVMEIRAGHMCPTRGQLHAGVKLLHDPLQERALIEKIIRAQAVVANLNRTGRPADQVKADDYRDLIGELLMMREEWRHANCPSN